MVKSEIALLQKKANEAYEKFSVEDEVRCVYNGTIAHLNKYFEYNIASIASLLFGTNENLIDHAYLIFNSIYIENNKISWK